MATSPQGDRTQRSDGGVERLKEGEADGWRGGAEVEAYKRVVGWLNWSKSTEKERDR